MLRGLLIITMLPVGAGAYSVLSHEAIIDAAWERSIVPALLHRFPNATKDDLRKAHAFSYGGAIIADLGYYPFGSHLFSDLTHYVRGGDFVEALLRESQNLNEYAFAIGAMAHYSADNNGHPIGINRAVPLLYPKLKRRFGPVITYEDNPSAHLKTEFAFDVAQVAHGNYAPEAYHDFIGFQVSKPVLERAFLSTYGLELKDVMLSVDLAIGTFRFSAGGLIPEMTKAAWAAKKKELQKAKPGLTKQKFIYNLSRASFEKEWGNEYERPGIWARFLAWIFRLVPKVGPFRAFAFHAPTPEAEKLFMESFNKTLDAYRVLLARAQAGGRIDLRNENYDTGKPSHYGSYELADKAYGELICKLADKKPPVIQEKLRANIDSYYGGQAPPDPQVAAAFRTIQSTGVSQ